MREGKKIQHLKASFVALRGIVLEAHDVGKSLMQQSCESYVIEEEYSPTDTT